jgi:serine/threonine-protein phosphatase 4 catalytic subunit
MEGYKCMFKNSLVTVWSAPNYCYRYPSDGVDNFLVANGLRIRCGNVAAILELDEQLNSEYKIFEAAPQESRGVPPKNPTNVDYFL